MKDTTGTTRRLVLLAFIVWVPACMALWWLRADTVLSGRMVGADDYMRMVQIHRFMDGGGWFDFHEYRLNPPAGVELHWTRLPDLPIAALISMLEPWLGRTMASAAAVTIWPASLLFAMLIAVARLSSRLVGPRDAPIALLFTVPSASLIAQFTFGRIDHHQWQLLVATIGLGLLLMLAERPSSIARAVVAAAVFAVGLWIGTEVIPWLALFSAALVLLWAFRGGAYARAGAIFGATLFALSLLTLLVSRAPGSRSTIVCDSFSIAYVAIAAGVMVFWMVLLLISRRELRPVVRLIGASAAALPVTVLLATGLSECFADPYRDFDPGLTALWLPSISEAKSAAGYGIGAVKFFYLPFLAMVIAVGGYSRADTSIRTAWLILSAFLVVGTVLSLWQLRFLGYPHAFSIPYFTWFAARLWARAGEWTHSLARIGTVFLSLVAMGPLPGIILAQLLVNATSPDDETVAVGNTVAGVDNELQAEEQPNCRLDPVVETLAGYREPRLIASYINPGAQLLYRTRHSVLAASYHRNSEGNSAMYRVLSSRDDGFVRRLFSEREVDLVLVCPHAPEMQYYRDDPESFAVRLSDGAAPDWLQPVVLPEDTNYRLYSMTGR